MMDLTERLRSKDVLAVPDYWRLQDLAADEIEKLREQLKTADTCVKAIQKEVDRRDAEIERLDAVASDLHQKVFDQSGEIERLTAENEALKAAWLADKQSRARRIRGET